MAEILSYIKFSKKKTDYKIFQIKKKKEEDQKPIKRKQQVALIAKYYINIKKYWEK